MKTYILKIVGAVTFMMALRISASSQQETIRKISLLTGGKVNNIKNVLPAKGNPVHVYVFRGVKGQEIDISINFTRDGEADFSFKLPNGENVDEDNIINTD